MGYGVYEDTASVQIFELTTRNIYITFFVNTANNDT